MKLFLDTANLEEIREAVRWGGIDGVTTNPSLMAKEQRDFAGHIRAICELVKGPVSAETVSADVAGMVREGRHLATIHPEVVVKVPLTKEGLQATRQLRRQNIRVNVTLCFSSAQALLAAKAGATYISPFVGRLDDIGEEGMALIRDIRLIYHNYRFATEILTASCRSPMHVVEAAKAGSDIATVPFAVLEQLVKHPLTTIGLERFLKDWEKIPADLRASILPDTTMSRRV